MDLNRVGIEWKPLWAVTCWNAKFKNVESFKQPNTFKCRTLSAKDARALTTFGGNVKILTSHPSNKCL